MWRTKRPIREGSFLLKEREQPFYEFHVAYFFTGLYRRQSRSMAPIQRSLVTLGLSVKGKDGRKRRSVAINLGAEQVQLIFGSPL